jgi:hypothetical protein
MPGTLSASCVRRRPARAQVKAKEGRNASLRYGGHARNRTGVHGFAICYE